MKPLLKIIAITFSLATGMATAADTCQSGETRCGPSGYVVRCGVSGWYSSRDKCGANIREQQLCTDGDEKCSASNSLLICRKGKWEIVNFESYSCKYK